MRTTSTELTELTELQTQPPEDPRDAVLLAVKTCPTHALSIQEDD
jgi:ferredoxin